MTTPKNPEKDYPNIPLQAPSSTEGKEEKQESADAATLTPQIELQASRQAAFRVIFLDFDGVLNSERSVIEEHEAVKAGNPKRGYERGGPSHWLAPYHIQPLNRIVEETGAKVVISSTWRLLYSLPELCETLRGFGFTGEIIGRTVDGSKVMPGFTVTLYGGVPRGSEICEWVSQNKPDSFVILDDDADMQSYTDRLVLTDSKFGLTEGDADRAIQILKRSLSPDVAAEGEQAAIAETPTTRERAGNDWSPFSLPFCYDTLGNYITDAAGHRVLDVRGWGYLTGRGHEALKLDEVVAGAIQDRIALQVVELINASVQGSEVLAGQASVDELSKEREISDELGKLNDALASQLVAAREKIREWSASLPEHFNWDWLREEMTDFLSTLSTPSPSTGSESGRKVSINQ